ncbi:kelch-like protein [Corallococcus sp. CA047B]|uniref:Kelch repeat-containing protein n=1 Tax=Corallococcus sp. CA047B TaxID=2316729 RepID=UPI000EA08BD1|nr:kelch motif-containing protein [Corallococcus sp. CA047B]RKH21501.1 kelch-like protein [Corallococcus sp. CA047B]
MKNASPRLLLALALALLTGCSAASDTGAARLAVFLPHAGTSAIARVSVTASGADMPSASVDLAPASSVQSGRLGDIPVGSHRSFLAQAFDASGALLFQGSASGVSISAGQSSFIGITLQEPNAPPASLNEPPVIDALVASSTSVRVGNALSLAVSAHGLHPDEPLSYAWSSSSGAFSSASASSTAWAASNDPGTQTLTLTVTDSGGLSASASLDVTVLAGDEEGSAQVTLSFNSAPRVDSLGATPARLAVGQSTAVSVSASDLEGDSLSYAWSASCEGSWANASSRAARFIPSALPAGNCNNCELTVAVSDGRGGQSTGTLSLCVGTTPEPHHFNPFILRSYSSTLPWEHISAAQVLTYEVAASDPEGSALSFSWAANTGSLGTPANTASQSRTTWTAPSCVGGDTTPIITATVTNAFNLTATSSFTVMGLPTCILSEWVPTDAMAAARRDSTATLLLNDQVLAAGGQNTTALATAELYTATAGTWSSAGVMRSARYLHTATRLQNGTVLVAGGYNSGSGYLAAAELYTPGSGTWSATGAMRAPRYLHTATRLLNGKVLVAGGFNSASAYLGTAELYDPASGTWSTTGAMASPRGYHTATLLPDGRVLVAGGRGTSFLATAELYDPASGTWSTTTGAMASIRASHTAALLTNGKVLVAGGSNTSTSLATAELYDPASGTWSATGPMASPRSSLAALVLNNGRVLVSGGRSGSSSLATTEVYLPASGTWSASGSMTSPRANHTATLLPNGKLLVSGGVRGSTPLSTADLYAP